MAYCHLIRRICFNLLRRLLFFTHGISPRHSAHLFSFASRIFLLHALHRRPACCSCALNVSCFRKSLVVHAHRARPRLPSCKRLRSKQCPVCRAKWRYAIAESQQFAKRLMSNVQTKMAFRPHRTTTDREASNIQCAKQNGDMPPPGNNRPRSKKCPVRRLKWRWCYNWSL